MTRSKKRQPPTRPTSRLEEVARSQLSSAQRIARRAEQVAGRAQRAADLANKRERYARRILKRISGRHGPMALCEVSFYLPMRDQDGVHRTDVPARKRGVGERKHHRDDQSRVWEEVQKISVAVPKKFLAGLDDGTVYWHVGAKMTPGIDDDEPILRKVPLIAARWDLYAHTSSKSPGIKFHVLRDLPKGAHDHNDLEVPNLTSLKDFAHSRYTATSLTKIVPPPADTMDLEEIQRPQQCVIDLLMSQYAAAITAHQNAEVEGQRRFASAPKMERKELWSFFNPALPYPGDGADFPVSLLQLKRLFEALQTKLVVLDSCGRLLPQACHMPHKSRLSPCYAMQADGHLYALNARLEELTVRATKAYEPTGDQLQRVVRQISSSTLPEKWRLTDPIKRVSLQEAPASLSDRANVPTALDSVFVESLASLATLDLTGHKGTLRVVCDLDLGLVAGQMLSNGVKPAFTRCHGSLKALRFNVQMDKQSEPLAVSLATPEAPIFEAAPAFTADEYASYVNHSKAITQLLLNHQTKSSYSAELHKALSHLMPAPMVWGIDTACETTDFDGARFYTSLLLNLQALAVFNEFDTFVAYNPEAPIDPYAIYLVRKRDPSQWLEHQDPLFTLLDRDVNCTSGLVLEAAMQDERFSALFSVEGVCSPSRVVRSQKDVNAAVKALYESGLPGGIQKFTVNRVVGLLGRKYNRRETSQAFEDIGAALNEGLCHLVAPTAADLGGKRMYFVDAIEETELRDGWRPIYHQIMCQARLQLYRKIKQLDRPVFGIKTDCIHAESRPSDVATPKVYDFDGVRKGSWTVLSGNHRPIKLQQHYGQQTKQDLVPIVQPLRPRVPRLHVADEFNAASMAAAFNATSEPIFIDARLAGSGKTTSVIQYALKERKSLLIACPYNALKEELRREYAHQFAAQGLSFQVITANKLLGAGINEETHTKTRKFNLAGFDIILTEEIYSWSTRLLQRLRKRMGECADVRWIGTGCPKQLLPIEPRRRDEDAAADFITTSVVPQLFKLSIHLQHSKRVSSTADRELLERIHHLLWGTSQPDLQAVLNLFPRISSLAEAPADSLALTYFRATADAVGAELHQRNLPAGRELYQVGRLRIHKGLKLRCCGYLKRNDIKLNPNIFATVKSVNQVKQTVTQTVAGDEATLNFTQVASLFSYVNGGTVHSSQGFSVDAPLVLCDTDCPFITRRWLWTAVTRARQLTKIMVFQPSEAEKERLGLSEAAWTRYWNNSVRSYKAQDTKAGRALGEDFVTAASMVELGKAQAFRCAHCGESVGMTPGAALQATADRLDNALSHTVANCVLACLGCNRAKRSGAE